MKKLKLHTIISGILFLTSNMHMQAMDQPSAPLASNVTNSLKSLATGLEKIIYGHAHRFERQLTNSLEGKQEDTLSLNPTTNSHELDWSVEEIIRLKSQAALVNSDRLLTLLINVEKQINHNPQSIEVSALCKKSSLVHLQRYASELQDEMQRVAKITAFLNGLASQATSNNSNQQKPIEQEFVVIEQSKSPQNNNNNRNNTASSITSTTTNTSVNTASTNSLKATEYTLEELERNKQLEKKNVEVVVEKEGAADTDNNDDDDTVVVESEKEEKEEKEENNKTEKPGATIETPVEKPTSTNTNNSQNNGSKKTGKNKK